MKKNLTLLFLFIFSATGFAQLNMTYKGNVTYNQELSDIWGYVTPEGNEYALVGVYNGVSIVDLADPENPVEVFFINGANSGWRDIKTWDEYAYVINETAQGLMVIDLTDLPNSVSATNWTPDIPGLDILWTCHNIFIDEFGVAYLAGCNLNAGGILYVDVATTPGTPVFIDKAPAIYSHDVYVRDNKMYSSEINLGQFAIYDVTDKSNTLLLGTQTTAFNFAHNTWLSDDSTILFTTDEQANAPVGSYDVSDPANILELDQFKPYETLGDGVIPHNVHVWNDWLIISYYTDGCILVDGSRPENLVEVGNFDTYIPASTGFAGAWGAYPYLPSGLVLVSDITNGMYVLEPNYVRACWLEGLITDASNGDPILGASVEILNTNVFEQSGTGGLYKTGYAIAGTYDVLVKKAGFEPATATAVLDNDVVTMLDVELTPLTPISVTGNVIDASTGEGIPDAIVSIVNDDFNYDITTDAEGNFALNTFFEGEYAIFAGKWGYKTNGVNAQTIDENNNMVTIEIEDGIEDIFSVHLGWETSFGGFSGPWERGAPIGVTVPGGGIFVTPPFDVPEDIGNSCYVTGNTGDLFGGVLIGGDAILTSPMFDLTAYNEPYMSYHLWYLNVDPNNGNPGNTDFLVRINNGTESVYVDTLGFDELVEFGWEPSEINIAAHIMPTDSMTVTFEASTPTDFSEITEAGVDFFQVWDAAPVGTKDLIDQSIQLQASPNPSDTEFVVYYELENLGNHAKVMVYNTLGQIVEVIDIEGSAGKVFIGDHLERGIYFAHISNGTAISKSLKLVKQ